MLGRTPWGRRALGAVGVIACGFAACSPGGAVDTRASVRDSAGIQIVENAGRGWSQEERWVVSPDPVLSIGAEDGAPEYLLSVVTGAIRLDDGRIVVADAGSSSIRFYGPDGRFLSRSGRQGQGPGEYVDIRRLGYIAGDTIVVADGVAQRISFLDSTGAYRRSMGLDLGEGFYDVGFYNVTGILEDGTILAYAGSGGGLRQEDAGRLIVNNLHFFWFRRTGEFGGRLTSLPGAPRWGFRVGNMVSFPYVPFAGGPVSAAGRGRFVVGSGANAELHVFDAGGELERIVRWPGARRASSAELERLQDHMLGEGTSAAQRRSNRQLLAEAPLPDSLPAAQGVVVDNLGYIWVEHYRPPWESEPTWAILDANGRWLGTVHTPRGLRIYEIGADYVLGVWRDEMNVEYVRMYALRRAGS